jgi:polar amino acid transport system substrate-binding protein
MKKILIFMLFTSSLCFGQEQIRVSFGDKLPPWVLKEKNKGIIFDLLVECLSPEGIKITPKYYPYLRRITAYQEGSVDAVIDINPRLIKEHKLKGNISDIAYSYVNYGISLKSKNYIFEEIRDLSRVSLLSWQGAVVVLGGEYAQMAKAHKRYAETYDQGSQVKMLFSKRVDVIQMDIQIFKHFRMLNSKKSNSKMSQEVTFHGLFGESSNSIFFKSKKVADLFNKNLKIIKQSGRYQQIIDSYSLEEIAPK